MFGPDGRAYGIHSKKPCRLLRYLALSRLCSSRLSRSTSSVLLSAASARRTWIRVRVGVRVRPGVRVWAGLGLGLGFG